MAAGWTIIDADVLEAFELLKQVGLGIFDAAFGDPPYGLSSGEGVGFMGLEWDAAVPGPEVWAGAVPLLRPGANVCMFGGSRTWDFLSVNMRRAGLEKRDTLLAWMYGSGWPKPADVAKFVDKKLGAKRKIVGKKRISRVFASHNFLAPGSEPRQADLTAPGSPEAALFGGWHANLKPSWEPALLFRKPLDGGLAGNALAHGVAGLNIDGCRIDAQARPARVAFGKQRPSDGSSYNVGSGLCTGETDLGRWPSNTILVCECNAPPEGPHAARCPVGALDEQSGFTRSGGGVATHSAAAHTSSPAYGPSAADWTTANYADAGGASRFFYVAKVSRRERGESKHPCMKPIELCTYIARLLLPPPRADGQPRRILVPYSGSGSEMIGCLLAGWDEVIGIENDPQWIAHAEERIPRELALRSDLASALRKSA